RSSRSSSGPGGGGGGEGGRPAAYCWAASPHAAISHGPSSNGAALSSSLMPAAPPRIPHGRGCAQRAVRQEARPRLIDLKSDGFADRTDAQRQRGEGLAIGIRGRPLPTPTRQIFWRTGFIVNLTEHN